MIPLTLSFCHISIVCFVYFFYYDIVVSFVLNGVILLLRSAFSMMGCKGDGSRRQFLVWFLMVGDV